MSSSTPGPPTTIAAATTFSGMLQPDAPTSEMSPAITADVSDNGVKSVTKATNILEDSSDAVMDQSLTAENAAEPAQPAVPKRRRGRPPAPSHLQAERRKEKLREVIHGILSVFFSTQINYCPYDGS
jgi:hypothetical protein